MTTSCELPRAAELQDTPHTRIDAATEEARSAIATLDLSGCNVTYINMPLQEHEKAECHRFEQWPAAIKARMEKEVAAFIERNKGGVVRAVTTGVHQRVCVLAIHWKVK